MRLNSWPQALGPVLFLAHGLLALRLLLKRGTYGVLGLALLAPWMLFFTELSTVRIQESFVLYRSYLWMPLLFASLIWLCRNALACRAAVALTILALILVPVTWQRLTTFSSPFALWHDAARLIHDKEDRPGIERIYHNCGLQLAVHGQAELALADFDKALALNSGMYWCITIAHQFTWHAASTCVRWRTMVAPLRWIWRSVGLIREGH